MSGLPSGASVSYMPVQKDFTNVGSYTISAVVTMENYSELTLNATLVIEKRVVEVKINSLQTKYLEPLKLASEYGYEILTQDAIAEGDDEQDLAIVINVLYELQNGYRDAGEYVITATSSSENYSVLFINGVYTITKLESVITAQDVDVVYDGKYHGIVAVINNDEQVISYSNANSFKDVLQGGYEVVISTDETVNYHAASITRKVTIQKRDIAIKINDLDVKPYEKDKKLLISNLNLRLYAHTSPEEQGN